jgi:hypothetical protein
VPERFSSEYVRIVIIGSMNKKITIVFPKTGRMSCSLMFIAGAPPIPAICRLWRSKKRSNA